MDSFEQRIKTYLETLHEQPDDKVWDKIARRQIAANRRLVWKRWLLSGLSASLTVLAWWVMTSENSETMQQYSATHSGNVHEPNLRLSSFDARMQPYSFQYPVWLDTLTTLNPDHYSPDNPTSTSKNKLPAPMQPLEPQKGFAPLMHTPAAVQDQFNIRQQEFLPARPLPTDNPQAAAPTQQSADEARLLSQVIENQEIIQQSLSPDKRASVHVIPTRQPLVALTDIPVVAPLTGSFAAEDVLVRRARPDNFRIGIFCQFGRFIKPHTEINISSQVGLMLESHIAKNTWLITGLQLGYGEYNVLLAQLNDTLLKDVVNRFPFNPYLMEESDFVSTEYVELSFPLGVSIYRNLGIRKLDGLVRGVFKPTFQFHTENRVWNGNSASAFSDIGISTANRFNWGWMGLQTGLHYRLFGRLRLEVAACLERSLTHISQEKAKLTHYGLHFGLKWGG